MLYCSYSTSLQKEAGPQLARTCCRLLGEKKKSERFDMNANRVDGQCNGNGNAMGMGMALATTVAIFVSHYT